MTLDSGPDVPPTHQRYDCFICKCSACYSIVGQCDCLSTNKPRTWHTDPDGCKFCAEERGVEGAKPPQYGPITCGICLIETIPRDGIRRTFQICDVCAAKQDAEIRQ